MFLTCCVGAVLSVDPYADYQRLYPGDVSNANHVFGAFKQTYREAAVGFRRAVIDPVNSA
jgi:hypothetical protein